MKRSKPYARRSWRGVTLNERTISAIEWVEKRMGEPIPIAQGSYNTTVNASGLTHAGGGALDWGMAGWPVSKINRVVCLARRAGFAAWYRPPIAGLWGPHIHAELLGDREASEAAKAQWAAYRSHRNGLSINAYDASWRPRIARRWNHRLNRPVLHPLPGQKLTPKQRKMLPKDKP